jgi:hypothetical protein
VGSHEEIPLTHVDDGRRESEEHLAGVDFRSDEDVCQRCHPEVRIHRLDGLGERWWGRVGGAGQDDADRADRDEGHDDEQGQDPEPK